MQPTVFVALPFGENWAVAKDLLYLLAWVLFLINHLLSFNLKVIEIKHILYFCFVIPVNCIQEMFPDTNGEYTGFSWGAYESMMGSGEH